MFRHIVLLTLRDDAPAQARDDIARRLRALPPLIDEIVSYDIWLDEGLAADNADLGVVASFANQADFEAYRDHPAHVAVVEEAIKPVVASAKRIQNVG